jgi:hypothetical protein
MEVSFLQRIGREIAWGYREYFGKTPPRGIKFPLEASRGQLLETPSSHRILQKAKDRLRTFECRKGHLILA